MLAGIRLPGLKLLMLGFRVIFPHARDVGVLGVYVVYLDNSSVVTSYLPSPDNLVGVPIRLLRRQFLEHLHSCLAFASLKAFSQ